MKQSNGKDYFFYFLLFIFTLSFGCLEFTELTAYPCGDAVNAYVLISQSPSMWPYTDSWHELLFIYEGRCLYQIVIYLFPHVEEYLHYYTQMIMPHFGVNQAVMDKIATLNMTSVSLIYLMWLSLTLMLYFMLCLLFRSMKHKKGTLFLFLVFLSLSFCYINYFGYAVFYKYIDGFFYPFVISAIIGIYFVLINAEKKRILWLVFVLFCLFHCVSYRRVAILSLPFFFYFMAPVFIGSKKTMRRAVTSLIAATVFGLGTLTLTRHLPSCPAYPATTMMYSDMSMAGILSGNWESFRDACRKGKIRGTRDTELTDKEVYLSQLYNGGVLVEPSSQENWNCFLQTYIDYICSHPKEMVLGRIISLIQFYSNGNVPNFVKEIISSQCPKAALNDKLWGVHNHTPQNAWGGYEKIYLFCISAIALICLICNINRLDFEFRFFIFLSVMGFVYSLSYWVVTPTPDARFHAFPVFAQCMFLSYLSARIASAFYHRFNRRSHMTNC